MVLDFELRGDAKATGDKIILTSLKRGNQLGSLWSKHRNPFDEWTLEMDISVSGPASVGGGLGIWYTTQSNKDGPVHGNQDNWDGLGLLLDSVDTTAGEDGTLRGHLNDGSVSYIGQGSRPDSQAFSMCRVNFRNTGGPFTIRMGYGKGSLVVDINGQKCFETDRIVLPANAYFGITAQSSAFPDSFMVHRLKVYSSLLPDVEAHTLSTQGKQHAEEQREKEVVREPPPSPPQQQQQQQSEEAIVHRQVEPSDNAINEILHKIGLTHDKVKDIDQVHSNVRDLLSVKQQMTGIETRMDRIENMFKEFIQMHGQSYSTQQSDQRQAIKQEIDRLSNQLDTINKAMTDHTSSLLGSLPDTVNQAITNGGPSIWVLFVVIIFVQGVLIVGYNVYKTRRSYHAKIL